MEDRALAKEANILYTVDVPLVHWRTIWYYFLERREGGEVAKKKEVSRSQVVVRAQLAALRHKIRAVRLDPIIHIADIQKETTLVWQYGCRRRKKVVDHRDREGMHRRCKRDSVEDKIPIVDMFKYRIGSNKVEESFSLRNTHVETKNAPFICLLCRIFAW